MARLAYEAWAPGPDAKSIIRTTNAICAEYQEQGYDLTLRQLYYQFVSRGLLPNRQQSYKRLGDIVNRGRLAGMVDWDYIVDRTRNLRGISHWSDPSEVVAAAANSYRVDKWATQTVRVEVWVEKDALAGIIERAAGSHDVSWFACRGYASQSELWAAGQRLLGYLCAGQRVVVLHLGDHDPSGIDMTRDITKRLHTFIYTDWYRKHRNAFDDGGETVTYDAIRRHMMMLGVPLDGAAQHPVEVKRIALNMNQVEQYDPPPNPAKMSDSRAEKYVYEYGDESWELDALDPVVLGDLIAEAIESVIDQPAYDDLADVEAAQRETLTLISDQYDEIAARYTGTGEE